MGKPALVNINYWRRSPHRPSPRMVAAINQKQPVIGQLFDALSHH